MQPDVEADLSNSAYDFRRVVWPVIKDWFGEGELVSVEEVSVGGFAQDVDIHAGIDGWHIRRGESLMRGIGSRVQWGQKCWDTFTIRYARDSGTETEYTKRLRAIKSERQGWLYPHVTVHAYVESPARQGDLLGVAALPTRDLFLLAEQLLRDTQPDSEVWGIRNAPNAKLLWISWDAIRSNGLPIKVWRRQRVAA